MKKDIQVHALPTEKASYNSILLETDGLGTHTKWVINLNPKFNEEVEPYKSIGGTRWNPHCLYITIDAQPKDGEYCINTFHPNEGLIKAGVDVSMNYISIRNQYKKVVATTDKELHKEVWSSNGRVLMAETQCPQISPEFQRAWVKAANEGKPIVDAVMEFEDKFETIENEYDIVTCTDNPKINDKGYVTILPKVEKMYPLIALKECFHAAIRLWPSNNEDNDFNEWLQIYEEVNS